MLKIAVLIFAIGALGGLVLASSVLRGRMAPWAFSLLHAALGATGLVLTGIVVLEGADDARGMIPIALLILIVAALGGFFLGVVPREKAASPKACRGGSCRGSGYWVPASRWGRVPPALSSANVRSSASPGVSPLSDRPAAFSDARRRRLGDRLDRQRPGRGGDDGRRPRRRPPCNGRRADRFRPARRSRRAACLASHERRRSCMDRLRDRAVPAA